MVVDSLMLEIGPAMAEFKVSMTGDGSVARLLRDISASMGAEKTPATILVKARIVVKRILMEVGWSCWSWFGRDGVVR